MPVSEEEEKSIREKIRKELEEKTAQQLFVIYKKPDKKGAKQIDKNNKRPICFIRHAACHRCNTGITMHIGIR